MPGRFDRKVALVTGGNSGIGRATALAFAKGGAVVVVADIDDNDGEGTTHKILHGGGEALFVRADVTRSDDVRAMINTTIERYGRLDYAFNNAGISGPLNLSPDEYPEEAWHQVIAVNLTGVWLCMKYEVEQMLQQGRGSIVNMASGAGLVGIGNQAYTASKHGVVGLTKSAAITYSGAGIRINAVCPGYIHTPMTSPFLSDPAREEVLKAKHPIGRLGEAEEVAEAVLWLCSDSASFVTGHAMAVDGGYVAQ